VGAAARKVSRAAMPPRYGGCEVLRRMVPSYGSVA
jgi:hypothetical protein